MRKTGMGKTAQSCSNANNGIFVRAKRGRGSGKHRHRCASTTGCDDMGVEGNQKVARHCLRLASSTALPGR